MPVLPLPQRPAFRVTSTAAGLSIDDAAPHGGPIADSSNAGLRIDLEARAADRDGRQLELTPKEFDLLVFLAAEPGRTFSRAQLLKEVWGSSSDWQGAATVTEHVHRLRAKLDGGRDRPALVFTVKGVGYRFAAGNNVVEAATAGGRRAHDALLVVVDGTIRTATAAASKMLSPVPPFAVLGREFASFISPSSANAFRTRLASAATGRWPRPEVLSVLRDDGSELRVEMASMPVQWCDHQASQIMLWPDDSANHSESAPGEDLAHPV